MAQIPPIGCTNSCALSHTVYHSDGDFCDIGTVRLCLNEIPPGYSNYVLKAYLFKQGSSFPIAWDYVSANCIDIHFYESGRYTLVVECWDDPTPEIPKTGTQIGECTHEFIAYVNEFFIDASIELDDLSDVISLCETEDIDITWTGSSSIDISDCSLHTYRYNVIEVDENGEFKELIQLGTSITGCPPVNANMDLSDVFDELDPNKYYSIQLEIIRDFCVYQGHTDPLFYLGRDGFEELLMDVVRLNPDYDSQDPESEEYLFMPVDWDSSCYDSEDNLICSQESCDNSNIASVGGSHIYFNLKDLNDKGNYLTSYNFNIFRQVNDCSANPILIINYESLPTGGGSYVVYNWDDANNNPNNMETLAPYFPPNPSKLNYFIQAYPLVTGNTHSGADNVYIAELEFTNYCGDKIKAVRYFQLDLNSCQFCLVGNENNYFNSESHKEKYSMEQSNQIQSIHVYDLTGRFINRFDHITQEWKSYLQEHLSTGLYILHLQGADQMSVIKHFIR